ncbi:MAG: hypothetical protein M1837_002619 [Sclerophora amabilis]|nr:MAG: hypothetical protein M1837_002619 [Sclerophora amabilis]
MAKAANWYRVSKPRILDLVSDYAGTELFLIEGDALLLECFQDERIDFEDGFQLLHAVYVVESFLENLSRRNCNFHIAFFDDHKHVCVPCSSKPIHRWKYLLARSVVIKHLRTHVEAAHPAIETLNFRSTGDVTFEQYLNASAIYFVMCHDGADAKFHGHLDEAYSPQYQARTKRFVRQVIHQFISRGLNVALINGLEWKDTKVMAMILETPRRGHKPAGDPDSTPQLSSTDNSEGDTESENESLDHETYSGIALEKSQFVLPEQLPSNLSSERDLLTVTILSTILRRKSGEGYVTLASAFLVHTAFLEALPLSQRRFGAVEVTGEASATIESFLDEFSFVGCSALSSTAWKEATGDRRLNNDLADLLDGRLFRTILFKLSQGLQSQHLPSEIQSKYQNLSKAFSELSGGIELKLKQVPNASFTSISEGTSAQKENKLLPFNNPIFDKHLASIQISIDSDETVLRNDAARLHHEVSHWHNARKLLDPKKTRTARTRWEEGRLRRSNQIYMADMAAYAASLTNASGKSLSPEPIIVQEKQAAGSEKSKNAKPDPQIKKQGKPKQGKMSGREIAAKSLAEKEDKEKDRVLRAWSLIRTQNLDKITDLESRYLHTKAYYQNLSEDKSEMLEAEIFLYNLRTLIYIWEGLCRKNSKKDGYAAVALIWDNLKYISKQDQVLSQVIVKHLSDVISSMKLPKVGPMEFKETRKLTFEFSLPNNDIAIGIPPREFQLLHAGPYMDRNVDSAPDNRVRFAPDGWQRKVLDELDAGRSLFVVAPTSAGKTFISFYAMEQVLRSGDDGILVYVAPTKALVNQIAAEIHARFSKKFRHGQAKSVWAIHTRDYRINDPSNCQILVTVPHILQIMLLSPSNAKSWSPRLRRIIFDEVHSIGQAEDGVVWEQLLLLAPCPIIALSATVGNPQSFSSWLSSTQKASGYELTTVIHPHRYSDLRKFIYQPPKHFSFRGLPERETFASLGLDGTPGFAFLHPVASLVNRSRGMPDDLTLEARDLLSLYDAMSQNQTETFPLPSSVFPASLLPEGEIGKAELIKWEKQLKEVLVSWMANPDSPFDRVVMALGQPVKQDASLDYMVSRGSQSNDIPQEEFSDIDPNDLLSTTLPLLSKLEEANALPAILFNYDRSKCEAIAETVLNSLVTAETSWKKRSKKYKKFIEGWEEYKKAKDKKGKKAPKIKVVKKGKSNEDDDDPVSKLDLARESTSSEPNPYEIFDPDAPCDGFHFTGKGPNQTSELTKHFRSLRWKGVPEWLLQALLRGIGVHHAGMNRKYRQVVEMFFRSGFLRVVIATGTLSLGINMPCATVVFSGDSVFLTALNFRQAAGRAGRRSFDYLGNVVFQNISTEKACRLLSSRLPDLNGHFPVTTSLILRLFTLLHGSNNSEYAVKAIDSLLSQPRLYMGGDSFKEQVLHHLRFSIEYLRRQGLLGISGEPLNFASCVSHLYYVENSSFAFHALLKEGYFHHLCADIDTQQEQTMRTLMLVLSHLFGRRPCRRADAEFIKEIVKKSPSVVFLPPLPEEARSILVKHNEETLDTFATYVRTFSLQHLTEDERKLPLSGMSAGSDHRKTDLSLLEPSPATISRSAFVALSGHGDSFQSIDDLCSSARQGVFLEKSVIPHLDTDNETPLNAYLYDFYMHESVKPLEQANGISSSDVWFLLNDFSMVLATIVASLANFMKGDGQDQMDMSEVQGSGDAAEMLQDEAIAEAEEAAAASKDTKKDEPPPKEASSSQVKKKEAVLDDWDEEDLEDLKISPGEQHAQDRGSGGVPGQPYDAWNESGDQGLKNVHRAMQLLKADFETKFKTIWS